MEVCIDHHIGRFMSHGDAEVLLTAKSLEPVLIEINSLFRHHSELTHQALSASFCWI